MIKVGIHGASGKMGKMIIECLKDSKFAKLSVAYSIDGLDIDIKDAILTDDLEILFKNCDVVIDFSIKFGTKKLLEFAKNHPKPLCIGTTGLEKEEIELLKECSKNMPILYATNMSLGVAVLNKLAFNASKALRDFDIEITEMHHKYKKDAPSGTALTLGENVAKARNLELSKVRISGRDGLIGQRSKDEIAIFALRGGDIVGRHRVGFYNEGEFIELSHTATSRATFANGAIKAAIWVSQKENGLYSIDDCLGI